MRMLPWTPLFHQKSVNRGYNNSDEWAEAFDHRFVYNLNLHFSIFFYWSLISILFGMASLFLADDFWKAFCLMHLTWGLINLLIFFFLKKHTQAKKFVEGNFWKRFQILWHLENMLWLNIGLDVVYVFTGIFLLFMAQHYEPQLFHYFHAFGIAVIIQGMVLLLLDNVFRWRHHRNYQRFEKKMDALS